MTSLWLVVIVLVAQPAAGTPEASLAKARAYFENGLLDETKRELIDLQFEEGTPIQDKAEAMFLLGSIAHQEKNIELARKHWTHLVIDYPETVSADKAKSALASPAPSAFPEAPAPPQHPVPSPPTAARVVARTDPNADVEVKSPLLLTVAVPSDLLSKPSEFIRRRTDKDAIQAGAVWDRKKDSGFLIDEPDPRMLFARYHTTETRKFICDKAKIEDVWFNVRKLTSKSGKQAKYFIEAHVAVTSGWYRQEIDLDLKLVNGKGGNLTKSWEDIVIGADGAASKLGIVGAGSSTLRSASWEVGAERIGEWFGPGSDRALQIRLAIVD